MGESHKSTIASARELHLGVKPSTVKKNGPMRLMRRMFQYHMSRIQKPYSY